MKNPLVSVSTRSKKWLFRATLTTNSRMYWLHLLLAQLTYTVTSVVRSKLGMLIEQWQKICILAERMIKRREAAAVRLPLPTRRAFMPSHFTLPPFSDDNATDNESMASSVFSGLIHPRRVVGTDPQADTARLTNALKVVVEVNAKCWRGDECELCAGVRQGLSDVATHTQQHGDTLEHRVSVRTSDPVLITNLDVVTNPPILYPGSSQGMFIGVSAMRSQTNESYARDSAIFISLLAICSFATTSSPVIRSKNSRSASTPTRSN